MEYTKSELQMFARKDTLTADRIAEIKAAMPAEPQAQIDYLIAEWRANSALPTAETEDELYSRPDKGQINNTLIYSLKARGVDTSKL
jgi:hypothetical protein